MAAEDSTSSVSQPEIKPFVQGGTPVPAPDAAVRVLVKGFLPMEHQLLNGTVMLSRRRRLPCLELVDDSQAESADVVLIDSRDAEAMRWAAARPWLERKPVIWVDALTVRPGHVALRRPVQWPSMPVVIARALEQTQTAQPVAQPQVFGAARRSVLLIDDSLAVHAYVRSLLEPRGYTVTVAASADAGIEAAAGAIYACILMDVLMPGMDGYEACRRIKSRARAGSAPPIVMLTSKSSPFDRIRGKMAGCDAYLTKPVVPDQLHEVLSRYAGGVPRSAGSSHGSAPRPMTFAPLSA